jgi:hypothetical protein
MEVPHQYPYNPPLRAILLFFGSGALWVAADWFPWRHIPSLFRLCHSLVGFLLVAVALIVGLFRISFEGYLWLDYDSMLLPIGLFQMRTARIEYTSIKRVCRRYPSYFYSSGGFVLDVATEKEIFRVLPTFFADNESFQAVEEFLNQKALENTRAIKFVRS